MQQRQPENAPTLLHRRRRNHRRAYPLAACRMFNPSWTALPLGTLLANLIGCFAIGAALALNLPANIKLFLITGLLGSLTTFSTFAAELVQLSQRQQWQNMFTALLLHLGGGVGAVVLGAWLVGKMAR